MRVKYQYTNKKHTVFGIMSSVFGMLSLVSYIMIFVESYKRAGEEVSRLGTAGFFATLFMGIGFVLGVYSLLERDKFLFFKIFGLVLNTISMICLSLILYAGAML